MSDILTWTIYNENDIINPPIYNGEFKEVRTELQNNINKLIQDFEEKYKVIVAFEKVDITSSKKRVDIRLIIDLKESKVP
jgi:hypothetical protein